MVRYGYPDAPHKRHSEERNKARRMNLDERHKREARYVCTQLLGNGK